MTSPIPHTTTVESKSHILWKEHERLSRPLPRRGELYAAPVSYGLRDMDERCATKEHNEEDANPFGWEVAVW